MGMRMRSDRVRAGVAGQEGRGAQADGRVQLRRAVEGREGFEAQSAALRPPDAGSVVQLEESTSGGDEQDKPPKLDLVEAHRAALDLLRSWFDKSLEANITASVALKEKMATDPSAKAELESKLEERMKRIKSYEADLDDGIAQASALLESEPAAQEVLELYQAERDKVAAGHQPLRRWEMRRELDAIDQQIAELDAAPEGESKADKEAREAKKKGLEKERNAIGETISASMTHFSQQDDDWKDSAYGSGHSNNTMGKNGCMPSAIAMAVNFQQQETLENLAGGTYDNVITPYDPSVTAHYVNEGDEDDPKWKKKSGDDKADYTAEEAKKSGAGLVQYGIQEGERGELKGGEVAKALHQVAQLFPGTKPLKIKYKKIVEYVRGGHPVIASVKTDRDGNEIEGHVIVFNAVSEDGKTVIAADPGSTRHPRREVDVADLKDTCKYCYVLLAEK